MKKLYNSTIDETIYTEKLANGLSVFIMPRQNYNRQYALMATDFGSIDLEFIDPESSKKVKVPEGIAHFLEHKLFEDKEESTFDKFAALGASTNAYTNFTQTAYLFSSTGNFEKSLLNLLDFVQTPYFTDENVEKEKGIIAQEIRMYDDDPYWRVYMNLLKGLYQKHPVRYDIAGTVDSINQISKEDLYLCYNTFYHPSNMVLFLTGNLQQEKIVELIRKNQADKKYASARQVEKIYPEEPLMINQADTVVEMNVSRPILSLGFKEQRLGLTPNQLIKQELMINILLDIIMGKPGELFQTLYEENLIDDNFSYNYVLQPAYGYIQLGGETRDPEQLYQRLIEGLQAGKKNLNQDNFHRIHKKYLGDFISTFNSFEATASEFISYFFRGVNFFDGLKILQEITLEEIVKLQSQIFAEERAVKSIVKKA